MSNKITVTRWVDLESEECKSLEYYSYIKKVVDSGLKFKIITSDSNGHLFMDGGDTPIHADIKGELVGIKFSKTAAN